MTYRLCRNQHAMTPQNTYTSPSGQERCRECQRAAHTRYKSMATRRPKPSKGFRPIDDYEVPSAMDVQRCSHLVRPADRFTAPGEFPARGHCGICGATVHRHTPGAPWVTTAINRVPAELQEA